MASINNEPNGRRTIQFVGADGKRRSIRLGKVSRRQAESVKVKVEEGELVEVGHGLLVVEAMKMENSLTAPVAGRVGTIHVVAGQTVEKDEFLMEMMPPETDMMPPDEESE